MELQEACPLTSMERDFCTNKPVTADCDDPKGCPCTDANCAGKSDGEIGFKFVYPPIDNMKYDEDGCPLQGQIECFVTQKGTVSSLCLIECRARLGYLAIDNPDSGIKLLSIRSRTIRL
jgi:hypothetical protein